MRCFVQGLLLLLLSFVFVSCNEEKSKDKTFSGPVTFAGKKYVSPKTIELGRQVYMNNCYACHGVNGKGDGPASKGLVPPPRDFSQGMYKWGNVLAGELPHDERLKEIIVKGLNGTAMLPWDIRGKSLDAVVQYIKTFAPDTWVGEDKALGVQIIPDYDPFKGEEEQAIALGKEVYHVKAQCWMCHRGYAQVDEVVELSKKYPDYQLSKSDFFDDYFDLKLQGGAYQAQVLPPDFTWHRLRTISNVEDLYVRIAAGISGSGMPSWQGVLTEKEIWAVSYYVKDLMKLKDSSDRASFISSIEEE